MLAVLLAGLGEASQALAPSVQDCPYIRRQPKGYWRVWALLSFLPLFSLSAFRDGVGTDTLRVYLPGYYRILYGFSTSFEPGFRLLNLFCARVFGTPQAVAATSSLLFLLFCWINIYSMSQSPPSSILLLVLTNVYFVSMNMVRQSIAIALFYFALQTGRKHGFGRFFLWMLAAASIHKSVLFLLPVWFFCWIPFRNRTRLIALSALLAAIPFWEKLFTWILLHTSYGVYLEEAQRGLTFGPWYFAVQAGVFFFLLFLPGKETDTRYGTLFLHFQMLSVFFAACSGRFPLAVRIVSYFSYGQVLFLPEAVGRIREKKIRVIVWAAVYLLYFINMWVTIVLKGGQEVLPYRSVLGALI